MISTLVIATIPDPHAAAREVRRVLKPDGRLRFFETLETVKLCGAFLVHGIARPM